MNTKKILSGTTEYNGWANYETWVVNLWLTNDEDLYSLFMEGISMLSTAYERAEWVKEQLTEAMYGIVGESSLYTDLINTSMDKVDWLEIVKVNQE